MLPEFTEEPTIADRALDLRVAPEPVEYAVRCVCGRVADHEASFLVTDSDGGMEWERALCCGRALCAQLVAHKEAATDGRPDLVWLGAIQDQIRHVRDLTGDDP